jgi:hypothetical protein
LFAIHPWYAARLLPTTGTVNPAKDVRIVWAMYVVVDPSQTQTEIALSELSGGTQSNEGEIPTALGEATTNERITAMHTNPISCYRLAQLHQDDLLALAQRHNYAIADGVAAQPFGHIRHMMRFVLNRLGFHPRGELHSVPISPPPPVAR